MKNVVLFFIFFLFYNLCFSQEEILKINIEKIYEGKIVDDKPVFNMSFRNFDSMKRVMTIENKNGSLMFKNAMPAKNSYSYGPISKITYEDKYSDELLTKFYWSYSNSYDDKKGVIHVEIAMVKNKLEDKNRIFVAVIMFDLTDNITQYEGYINSSEFIKITDSQVAIKTIPITNKKIQSKKKVIKK